MTTKKKPSKTRDRLEMWLSWSQECLSIDEALSPLPHKNKQEKSGVAVRVCNPGIQEGETEG